MQMIYWLQNDRVPSVKLHNYQQQQPAEKVQVDSKSSVNAEDCRIRDQLTRRDRVKQPEVVRRGESVYRWEVPASGARKGTSGQMHCHWAQPQFSLDPSFFSAQSHPGNHLLLIFKQYKMLPPEYLCFLLSQLILLLLYTQHRLLIYRALNENAAIFYLRMCYSCEIGVGMEPFSRWQKKFWISEVPLWLHLSNSVDSFLLFNNFLYNVFFHAVFELGFIFLLTVLPFSIQSYCYYS